MVGFLKDQTTLDTVDICISLESKKILRKISVKNFEFLLPVGILEPEVVFNLWFQGFYRYQIEALAISFKREAKANHKQTSS